LNKERWRNGENKPKIRDKSETRRMCVHLSLLSALLTCGTVYLYFCWF